MSFAHSAPLPLPQAAAHPWQAQTVEIRAHFRLTKYCGAILGNVVVIDLPWSREPGKCEERLRVVLPAGKAARSPDAGQLDLMLQPAVEVEDAYGAAGIL